MGWGQSGRCWQETSHETQACIARHLKSTPSRLPQNRGCPSWWWCSGFLCCCGHEQDGRGSGKGRGSGDDTKCSAGYGRERAPSVVYPSKILVRCLFRIQPQPYLMSYSSRFHIHYRGPVVCYLWLFLCYANAKLYFRLGRKRVAMKAHRPSRKMSSHFTSGAFLPLLLCLPRRRSRYLLQSNSNPLLNDFICLITLNDRARPTTSRFWYWCHCITQAW